VLHGSRQGHPAHAHVLYHQRYPRHPDAVNFSALLSYAGISTPCIIINERDIFTNTLLKNSTANSFGFRMQVGSAACSYIGSSFNFIIVFLGTITTNLPIC
jgi:hypothetical protein